MNTRNVLTKNFLVVVIICGLFLYITDFILVMNKSDKNNMISTPDNVSIRMMNEQQSLERMKAQIIDKKVIENLPISDVEKANIISSQERLIEQSNLFNKEKK